VKPGGARVRVEARRNYGIHQTKNLRDFEKRLARKVSALSLDKFAGVLSLKCINDATKQSWATGQKSKLNLMFVNLRCF
jgi:hypothetical protein